MTTITIVAVCARCGEPRPDDRTLWCSRKCERGAAKARRRKRAAAGIPPGPARTSRTPRARRSVTAYQKFETATVPGKRVQVPTTPDAQRKAELLIERGCCAYRNARGLIRDVGVPKKAEHRGKVWAASARALDGGAA
jgi:predicted nucleic acid-binding Zn ribbon protein